MAQESHVEWAPFALRGSGEGHTVEGVFGDRTPLGSSPVGHGATNGRHGVLMKRSVRA
jgi:hypothetical protein